MRLRIILFACIVLSSVADITCQSGQTYIKIRRNVSAPNAADEKHSVKDGATPLIVSLTYANLDDRTDEYCVASAVNDQYTLVLEDSFGDGWNAKSIIEVYGKAGNMFFKGYMHSKTSETISLSMKYFIGLGEQWKMMATTAPSDWKSNSFGDSSWTTVTAGAIEGTFLSNQYYRKQFTGLASFAAYEASVNYRYGIVMYLNGKEIFRDQMPSGEITPDTTADGLYTEVAYRGIIRNGYEIGELASAVFAVELHFLTTTTSQASTFNMFVAGYANSIPSTDDAPGANCFPITATPQITGTGYTPTNIGDWSYSTSWYEYQPGAASHITYAYPDGINFITNAMMLYHHTSITSAAKSYELQGSTINSDSGPFTTYARFADQVYTSLAYKYAIIDFPPTARFRRIRLKVSESYGSYVYLFELRPMVCNTAPQESFSYPPIMLYANLDSVRAVPNKTGMSGCSGSLPNGLTVDPVTCIITGTATTAGVNTYTITATSPFTIQGSVSVTVMSCLANSIEIRRNYSSSSSVDIVNVYNADNGSLVWSELAGTTQIASGQRSFNLCVAPNRLKVVLSMTAGTAWYAGSYISIFSIVDGANREMMLRARLDGNLQLPDTYYVNVKQHITTNSAWKYSFPSSAPAATFYNNYSSWSEAATSALPATASNQYQLYAKEFTVSAAELAAASGFSLGVKYAYGIIVYMNGVEVYRNNVSATAADIAGITSSTNSYTGELKVRRVTLPVKFMYESAAKPGAPVLIAGVNKLVIGLIAPSASTTAVTFDANVRLFGSDATDRVLDFTPTASGTTGGTADNLFDKSYSYSLMSSNCNTNSATITFADDRREWISSISLTNDYYVQADVVGQFTLQGKNSEDATWTTLITATGWKWWTGVQVKRAYFVNNKSFNAYRLLDIGSGKGPGSCNWRISNMMMYSDKTDVTIPDLTYSPPSEVLFKDIEMPEWYPDQLVGYSNFSVEPELPTGVAMDPPSGVMMGTPTEESAMTPYTISAYKTSGQISTFVVNLQVSVCTNGRSLITFTIRVDNEPTKIGYAIYNGKTTSGTAFREKYGMPAGGTLIYVDSCLNHNMYTARFYKNGIGGWNSPGAYSIGVDVSGMRMDIGWVLPPATGIVSETVTYFSSYLPWQVDFHVWKVLYGIEYYPDNWNTNTFDDAAWSNLRSSDMATITVHSVTTFYRTTFGIESLSEYPVLNVRVRYSGGIICYLNGNRVGRFNIIEFAKPNTEALVLTTQDTYSRFHVVLQLSGAVVGANNVFAVEHHRAPGVSSSQPQIFDSTAVFGVNDCSFLSGTVTDLRGIMPNGEEWKPSPGLETLFDQVPWAFQYIENTAGYAFEWQVANLERSIWNSYFLTSAYTSTNSGFSFSAKHDKHEDWNEIQVVGAYTCHDRTKSRFSLPMGMAGFKYFRWHVDSSGSDGLRLFEIGFEFCKISGNICEAQDGYPAVGEGEQSPGKCPYGYQGYTLRPCSGGVLGDVDISNCRPKPPVNLEYDLRSYTLVVGTTVFIPAPLFDNTISFFYVDPSGNQLPDGLVLDADTGAISGIPTTVTSTREVVVYGTNDAGAITTSIMFTTRKGVCTASKEFAQTEAGVVGEYKCSERGAYVGTIKQPCNLGRTDGEWGAQSGTCVSVVLLVVLVIVVILIILIVVFVMIRKNKKKKSVGGVKNKGKSDMKKSPNKKQVAAKV